MNRRDFMTLGGGTALLAAAGLRAVPPDPSGLLFGVIADVQYANADPEGERHYRSSLPKLKAALTQLADDGAAIVLHLGDVVDRDFESFADVLPLFEACGLPVYHLLGNHDYSLSDSDKARVPSTLGLPHDYYTLLAPGLRVLMLDTTDTAPYKYPLGSPEEQSATEAFTRFAASAAPSAKPWNGGISKTQIDWMDRQLSAADTAGERVLLCGHHPLLPAESHQLWNADDVLAVIDRHPSVIAYFNAHRHSGAEVIRKGVPYITFKSLLHEPATTAYALIRIHADQLTITGHGREPTREFLIPPHFPENQQSVIQRKE